MTGLSSLIHAEILEQGSIGFDRFMELALYHPELGYYRVERSTPRTGRTGDFMTSVSVGPLFGRLLARQFLQMWELLNRPAPFWIIEQGGEDGRLACDILSWCRAEAPLFYDVVRYGMVESSERLRAQQDGMISGERFSEKVFWFRSLDELAREQPVGAFFSNELVDAFPVCAVTCQDGIWQERRVALGERGEFVWIARPIADAELAEAVKALGLPIMEGYTTEISVRAGKWMREVGQALARGYVLTIDYGFPAELYYAAFRSQGTLTGYREHRRTEDVLAEPGLQDLTAHVDFTRLIRAGEEAGLATLGLVNQEHFFVGIAHDELRGTEGPRAGLANHLRAWQALTHPGHLGGRFWILAQGKQAPRRLMGLRYAGGLA